MEKLTSIKILFIIILLLFISGCAMEYSPYAVTLKNSEKKQTNLNLNKLKQLDNNPLTSYKIAFISDSHYWYDSLERAVKDINNDETINFVVYLGDLTQYGMLKEFRWTNDILQKLNKPILVIVGNHDLLNNGEKTYKEMFGNLDYTFTFQKDTFIVVNTSVWESSEDVPNFNWLENELKTFEKNKTDYPTEHSNVFVLSHVPPFDPQFSTEKENQFKTMLKDYDVKYSVHGHQHRFDENFSYDEVPYLLVDTTNHNNYTIMTIENTNIYIDRIYFN